MGEQWSECEVCGKEILIMVSGDTHSLKRCREHSKEKEED